MPTVRMRTRLALLLSVILVSCTTTTVVPEVPLPVLAWPADECPANISLGPDAITDDHGEPKRAELIKGIQVFFADYLRHPDRGISCNRSGATWTAYCIRSERVDSFFFIDSVLSSFGDQVGFADIRFRNGYRFRMCLNGGAYPLDGAHFTEGQERCPKGDRSRRQALPEDCWSDSARLLRELGP